MEYLKRLSNIMEQPMFTGTIYITSDIEVVYNFPLGAGNKIINLDEDGLIPEDDENIIGGSCLLPPIMAKIAESDGDEYTYEMLYKEHLLDQYQRAFIGALIAGLYKGKNLLLFLPELGYTFTRDKLCQYVSQLYGIGIGIMEQDKEHNVSYVKVPFWYDYTATPIWLALIYEASVIGPYEYLARFPLDADLRANEKILNLLIKHIKPYGATLNDQIEEIKRLHKKLHKDPNTRPIIHRLV